MAERAGRWDANSDGKVTPLDFKLILNQQSGLMWTKIKTFLTTEKWGFPYWVWALPIIAGAWFLMPGKKKGKYGR